MWPSQNKLIKYDFKLLDGTPAYPMRILQKRLIGSAESFSFCICHKKSKTRLIKLNGSGRIPSVPKYKLKVKESMTTGKHAEELFDIIYSIRFYNIMWKCAWNII